MSDDPNQGKRKTGPSDLRSASSFPSADGSLDALLRGHMDVQAERQDVSRLRERISLSLETDARLSQSPVISDDATVEARPVQRREWPLRMRLSASWYRAIAILLVSVLLSAAFLAGRFESEAQASPAELLRAAKVTHAEPVERVYLVTVERAVAPSPAFALPQEARVIVFGDRFRVEMNRGERRMEWGRDASGTIWMVTQFGRGMVVEPSEIGPGLEQLTDIYSLNLETLLDDALAHCRLENLEADPSIHRIHARAERPGRGGIVSADIEVDRETKAIRKLVIERSRPLRWGMKVTFLLTDSQPADESQYAAEGHLPKGVRIFSRNFQPERRKEIFTAWLGGPPDRWILPAPEAK